MTKPINQTYFQKWYSEKKQELSEKRKERYAKDSEYRAQVLERTRRYKQARRNVPPPDAVTIQQAAEHLGIGVSSLREWKKRGYYPVPLVIGNRWYFTQYQTKLLSRLVALLKGRRKLTSKEQDALDNVVNDIFANWE